jgi:3-(3-hydroxy-phenyl)propionate hydroxylase
MLARFQGLAAGDLVMTGTPVGTALSAPPKPLEIIGSLLLDSILGDGFALVTIAPPNDMQRCLLQERGAVAHIAAPDGELAAWLRHTHVTSAIVRPDRTVMWAGRDMRRIRDLLPTFRPEKRIRSLAVGRGDIRHARST